MQHKSHLCQSVKLRKDGGADVEGWHPRPSTSGWTSWPSTSWTSWTGGTCECEEFPDHPHIFLFLRILESTQDFGGAYTCSNAFLVFFPSLWDFLPQRQSHASSKFFKFKIATRVFCCKKYTSTIRKGSAKFCSSSIHDWYLFTLIFSILFSAKIFHWSSNFKLSIQTILAHLWHLPVVQI